MRIVNPAIIGHPMNWFTILGMVLIAMFALDQASKLLKQNGKVTNDGR